MSDKNHSWIPQNIFIKCLYSSNISAQNEWFHSDKKTNYCNIVLVYDGFGLFECNGEKRIVKRGDLIYFPEGVKRLMKVYKNKNLSFRSFNFRYRILLEHKTDWWIENPILPLEFVTEITDLGLFKRLEHLFSRIQEYYTTLQYSASSQMRYYATEILSLLLSSNKNNISFSEKNIINKSIEFMSQHFTEKITLQTLADHVGKSVSYYGKCFKKSLGMTPIEYLLSARIAYSKTLLKNGISVTNAAKSCGFSDVYYFSKMFRAKENMTPSEYKKISLK